MGRRVERTLESIDPIIDETEWPTVTIPEGEGVYPSDPLFDSDRTYPQNVARVQRHKNGGN